MTLKPVGEWLLCRLVDGPSTSAGGIVIPKLARAAEPIKVGEVLALGDGVCEATGLRRAPTVRVGDHVHFPEHAGEKFDSLGDTQVFVRESACLGYVRD